MVIKLLSFLSLSSTRIKALVTSDPLPPITGWTRLDISNIFIYFVFILLVVVELLWSIIDVLWIVLVSMLLRPMLLEISFIVSVSFTNGLPNCVQRYEKISLAFNRKQCTVFVHNNLTIDFYLNSNPKKKSFKYLYFLDISKRSDPNLQRRPRPQMQNGNKN